MAKATRFLGKMSWFMVLVLVIVNLASTVDGNIFGSFALEAVLEDSDLLET